MEKIPQNSFFKNPLEKKILGTVLVVVGFFALLTPLLPGSWLIFIGFQLLGVQFLFWEKAKKWFKK